jgi:hypothetical protein
MMAKYRKKPIVIEAFRWEGEECPDLKRIDVGRDELGCPRYNLEIPTLEGTLYASEGDWIIQGIQGEIYPCRDDIFRATYEPAEE